MSYQTTKHTKKMEIAAKYQMTKNIQGYLMLVMVLLVACGTFGWWGFSNFQDPVLKNIDPNTRQLIAWIASVSGVILLAISGFLIFVIRNARNHIKMLIGEFDKTYPTAKYDGAKFGNKQK